MFSVHESVHTCRVGPLVNLQIILFMYEPVCEFTGGSVAVCTCLRLCFLQYGGL